MIASSWLCTYYNGQYYRAPLDASLRIIGAYEPFTPPRLVVASSNLQPLRGPRIPHMPRRVRALKLHKAEQRFTALYGYAPNRSELARYAGVSKPTVTRALGAVRKYKRQVAIVEE